MSKDYLEQYDDLLPEGGVPIFGYRVLTYVSSEGETCYRFDYDGSTIISQMVGIMEMVKHDVASTAVNSADKYKRDDE